METWTQYGVVGCGITPCDTPPSVSRHPCPYSLPKASRRKNTNCLSSCQFPVTKTHGMAGAAGVSSNTKNVECLNMQDSKK